jgi:transposase-like protein
MHPVSDSSSRRTRRRSAEEWRAIVERFQQSGLKEKEFCARENLAQSSLDRWRRRFLSEGHRPGFVELRPFIPTAAPTQGAWTVEVDLPGGTSLRIRCGR